MLRPDESTAVDVFRSIVNNALSGSFRVLDSFCLGPVRGALLQKASLAEHGA